MRETASPQWKSWTGPAVLFMATLVMRSWLWNYNPIGWDEWIQSTIASRMGLWAIPEHRLYDILVPTGYSYPPLFPWVSGLFVYVFGASPIVWRMPTILSEAAAVSMVFVLGRGVGGRLMGWAAGLFAWSTLYLGFHDSITLDFALSFWILLSMHLLFRCMDENSPPLLFCSLLAGSAALFTKYHGIVYFAPLCAFVIALPRTRAMILTRRLSLFLGATLTLPCVMLALEGLTWRFYGLQKTHVTEVFRVMTWKSYVADPISGAWVEPAWHYYFVYCAANINWVICVLCVTGTLMALAMPRRRKEFLLAVFICLWLLWASTGNLKNARYVLPGVFAAFVLAGVPLRGLARYRWGKAGVAVLISVSVALGLWSTVERVRAYKAQAADHRVVHELLNAEAPVDARMVADSRAFQSLDGVGISPIKRSVANPENYRPSDTDFLITHEDSFDFVRVRDNEADRAFVEDREKMVRDWSLLLDVGEGRNRIRVFRRP